ncbi:LuxR family two component transcriptional regulator [Rhodopseudomonas faecalis]|uniref:LuxR family two component transcriptional regulator n=2 Tax=Rhodopseudomonas faecalis TaxID=99655 RepID=A0A318TDB6_9BRAD|nr:LuxR family two component transcriptional regulator [Rhodopseudomonas faecalis]TAH67271.1 MAG: response regulator transcription factor [Rhodopseudomonas palustris]
MDQRLKDTETLAPLRAFVAEDCPMVFNRVDTVRGFDGTRSADETATRAAVDGRSNVVVLDLTAPDSDGLETARAFMANSPGCRVLALTAQDADRSYLRRLLDAGISGYVSQRSSAAELMQGIRTVGAGGVYRDPAISDRLVHSRPAETDSRAAVAELSAREIEVLKLAAAGHSNKTIAAKLQIGSKSVETYKARGMAKLGFHSRVEVVRFALSVGWLSPQ